jgi:hypothetical protein
MEEKNMAKKFKIIVNGQQEEKYLEPLDPHEYHIQGDNKEEAINQAMKIYRNVYPDAVNIKVTNNYRANGLAIICMLTACFFSFIPWYSGPLVFSLKPSMLSTLLAIGLYSALVIRLKGLHNSFCSPSDTILSLLTILFCSSFINFFLNDNFGKILLLVSLLLSWLGLKFIAGIVWIVLIAFVGTRVMVANTAMGVWGSLYILSAFLGIVLQLKQVNLLRDIGREFKSMASRAHYKIFNDVSSVTDFTKSKKRKAITK